MDTPVQLIRWQTVSGPSWKLGGRNLTAESRALAIRLPFGGYVWNRAVAIVVEEEGKTTRVPIFDVTRMAVLVLSASSIVASALIWLFGRSRRERS
jgi:hypothetical protein